MSLSQAKRISWFRDQYQHPAEVSVLLDTVMGWFRACGLRYVSTLPRIEVRRQHKQSCSRLPRPAPARNDRCVNWAGRLQSAGWVGCSWLLDRRRVAVFQLLRDLVIFAKENRTWWLLPIVICIVLIGALAVFAESSVVGPWIYAMF